MKIIWLDGKFLRSNRATVSVLSHALHYGTGAFEGIRAYETENGPGVFRLKEHIDRLFYSVAPFKKKIPYTKKEITDAITSIVARNKFRECYVRPLVYFGEGTMSLSPGESTLHVAIAAWPWGAYLGERDALSIGISSFIRFHPRSVVPGAKISGFYAASALVTLEAKQHGFDECVLLDHKGLIAEGPGENIFIVKNKILYTPKPGSILPGITRKTVMQIADDMGIRAVEKDLRINDLLAADEAFFTGTAAEIAPIGKVNNRRIGAGNVPGPLTAALQEKYLATVHGNIPRYRRWIYLTKETKK